MSPAVQAPAAVETREVVFDNLRSGLGTDNMLEADPPALRVTWIAWDSGFRGSGLEVGDQIIAVEGAALARPAGIPELQRLIRELPGGLDESQAFAAKGLKDGSPLRLTIRRRRYPGEGWLTQEIAGKVLLERAYSYASGRRAMGPAGPDGLANDGFDATWSGWYEKRVLDWTRALDQSWGRTLSDTRMALKPHMEAKPRVDFVSEKYPGPFADAVRADWEAVHARLAGTRYTLPADALDYRQLGEQRAKVVAAAAAAAWQDFRDQRAAEIIPAFPSVNPLRDDCSKLAGKLVVLPPIAPRDWLVSIDATFLSAVQDGYWYFAPLASPAMRRLYGALNRYRRFVSPDIREEIALVGRILPEPRMMAARGRTAAGLEVEPLAALVGGAMFVDLTAGDEPPFAGEAELKKHSSGVPADSASPREVLEALGAALKAGDQDTWNALFADWRLVVGGERPLYYAFSPYTRGSRDEHWVASRRFMLDKVCDVRVSWTDDARLVLRGDEFEGAPRIEEVRAEIEHVGLFDGEQRAFCVLGLHRSWTLQRRDGGPWRIASHQGI
ncbi:MAG TPA: hypothetical protein VJN20_12255 [Burkholderiales bacterium]|nr:hypothetical protein [Burkholderiales bacterium]